MSEAIRKEKTKVKEGQKERHWKMQLQVYNIYVAAVPMSLDINAITIHVVFRFIHL